MFSKVLVQYPWGRKNWNGIRSSQEEVCRIAALQIARWMKSLVKILENYVIMSNTGGLICLFILLLCAEAALQRRSYKKLFWKYPINLQKNTHAEVWFQ